MTGPNLFRQGMRRLASGVSIVTTLDGGSPQGFAATAVSSVCAEPSPILLICVNRTVSCHGTIHRGGLFCVNVLAEDDVATAYLFSSSEKRHLRFKDAAWEVLTTGAPALTAALASFDCRVTQAIEVQSHTIFLGEVVATRLRDGEHRPLLYVGGRFEGLREPASEVAVS